MAPATNKSSLNANAAPFIPGRREHAGFAPSSEPKTRYRFRPEALPYYPHGLLHQQALLFGGHVGYQDAQHEIQFRNSSIYPYYSAHAFYTGQQGYYPIYSHHYPAHGAYYYPQAPAPAPWYPLNDTRYIQPAEPFAPQLLEIENARMNLEMYDDDNKSEDDDEDSYEDNYEGSKKFGDWYQKQSGRNNNYRSARRGRRERRAAEKRAAEQSAIMENDGEAEKSGKGKEKAIDGSDGW